MGKKSKRNGAGKKSKQQQAGTPAPASKSHVSINADDDIDAKVEMRLGELAEAAAKNEGVKLRFSVGDRVACKLHTQSDDEIMDSIDFDSLSFSDIFSQAIFGRGMFETSFVHGIITQLWWCEKGSTVVHPYQIRLDDGNLIYAVST